MLTTREQVTESLNNHFGEEMSYWSLNSRMIWAYNADNGTGKYRYDTNLDYSIKGQIGKPVEKLNKEELQTKYPAMWAALSQHLGELVEEIKDTDVAFYVRKGIIWRKPFVSASMVRKLDVGYELVIFPSYLYDKFFENLDKMKDDPSYDKAVELSGIENPTQEQIATRMSTIIYTSIKDVPDSATKVFAADAKITLKEGVVDIEGIFTIDGKPADALRWRWFLDPADKVPGLSTHPNAGGEYVGRKSFSISSDFRERKTFIIMSSKNVRVRGYCQYLESDGELKQVIYDKVHDFSEYLPVYDYFGLV